MRNRGAHQTKERALYRLHRSGHRGITKFRGRRPIREASIADQHVQSAEPRHRLCHQRIGDSRVDQIAERNLDIRAGCLCRCSDSFGAVAVLARMHHQRDAGRSECAAGRRSDATCGACHENDT